MIGSSLPDFDPRTWRLRIDGLVEQPHELRYTDLLRLPRAEQTSDFHCVTGWTVANVRWAGVRFQHLRIELVARPADGFWEKLGYDRDAWVGHSNVDAG
jgi:DMSO/TMAO reductase YedYZ molybdopterin-dependent catalytic subunit